MVTNSEDSVPDGGLTIADQAAFAVDKHKKSESLGALKASVSPRAATLYAGLNIRRPGAALEPVLFVARRIVLAALLVLVQGEPLIAGGAILLISIALVAYTAVIRPFEDAATNKMAMLNETLLATCVTFVVAVEFFASETNAMVGWALIALVSFVVLCNVCFMLG